MSISVIVPTLGRDTLERTLDSLKLRDEDELILIADAKGKVEYVRELAEERKAKFDVVRNVDGIACNHRNRGMLMATKNHICFLDDDDVHTKDAMRFFRIYASDKPTIFRMFSDTNGVIWDDEVIRFCNVGTPMFLIPNKREKLGWWKPNPGATGFHPSSRDPVGLGPDFVFIQETVKNFGALAWRPEVVALVSS